MASIQIYFGEGGEGGDEGPNEARRREVRRRSGEATPHRMGSSGLWPGKFTCKFAHFGAFTSFVLLFYGERG